MSISFTMGDSQHGVLTTKAGQQVRVKGSSDGLRIEAFAVPPTLRVFDLPPKRDTILSPQTVILDCPIVDISKVSFQNKGVYRHLFFYLGNGQIIELIGREVTDTPYREIAHKMQLLIKDAKATQRALGKAPTKAGLVKSAHSLQAAGLLTDEEAEAIQLEIKERF